MANFSIFKKSAIGVALCLMLAFMLSLGAAAGTLSPGYSDSGENVDEPSIPLADVEIGEPSVPLADIEIDDAPAVIVTEDEPVSNIKTGGNPATGDNVTLFVMLAGISLAALGTGAVALRKKIRAK